MKILKFLNRLRKVNGRIKGGNGPFRYLYIDPPWQFENWSTDQLVKYDLTWAKRNGRSPYPVMKQDDLFEIPIWELGAKDSVMLMWATWPKLLDAIELMYFYGYTFRTVAFVWVKLNPTGHGWHFGCGYYTHANTEFCLLGRRGNGVKRHDKSISQLIIHPRGEHSAKPPIVRDRIVQLFGDKPRAELFARQVTPGWSCWGNEVPYDQVFEPIAPFIAPPAEVILDDDEAKGLPITDTEMIYQIGDQMVLM